MQPKNGYKCYKAGKKELFDTEFAKMLATEKKAGNMIYVVCNMNGDFDHWDIEEYNRVLRTLDIDMLYLKISDDKLNRPKYRDLTELNGALHHYTTFIAFDEKTGYQEFHYGDMRIFFEYPPNE